MAKKLKRFESVNTLMKYLKPYRRGFIISIVMLVVTCAAMVTSPNVEGMITNSILKDVTDIAKGVPGARFHMENVVKIIMLLLFIYAVKTAAQMISMICITNSIQDTMRDLRNACIFHMENVVKIIMLLLFIYAVKTAAQMISMICITNSIQDTMRDLRNACIEKINALPVKTLDSHPKGDILSRITNDIDAISNAMQQTFMNVISGVLMVCFAIFMMFRVNLVMTVCVLVIIPISYVIIKKIAKISQKSFDIHQRALGELSANVTESFSGYNEIILFGKQEESVKKFEKINENIRETAYHQRALGELSANVTESFSGYNEIILFGKQEESVKKFEKINENIRETAYKAQFLSYLMSPLLSLLTYLSIGVVSVIGTIYAIGGVITVGQLQAFVRFIWQVNDLMSPLLSLLTYLSIGVVSVIGTIYAIGGVITVGQLQAFVRFIWQVNEPLTQVSQLSSQIQSALSAMDRIHEFIEYEEEIDVEREEKEFEGNVEFKDIRFGYGEKEVLHGVSLDAKKGETVAIVGPTGSGKTTIVNLLMRFYDPNSGSILIDGTLHGVSLDAKKGETVAIVGPTGSGKTTIVNLLMRFYDPNSGSILIDGTNSKDINRSTLRDNIGMVLQDTWLFTGSIRENIRFSKPDATDAEIEQACKYANAC